LDFSFRRLLGLALTLAVGPEDFCAADEFGFFFFIFRLLCISFASCVDMDGERERVREKERLFQQY
jgi:hypothetical protein